MGELSVETRRAIVEAVAAGKSKAAVAREHGVGVATVRRWCVRHQEDDALETRQRPGAPPILTPEEVVLLGEMVTTKPGSALDELVDALEAQSGKRVSTTTIRRALAKAGLRRVRPKVQKTDEPAALAQGERYKEHHRREPELGRYPSSLTDSEWELLKPEFDHKSVRGRGRPRVHEPRVLLDAIFYVIRTGCAWRYLPGDFPAWQTVYAAFRAWSGRGCFERMHVLLAQEWRVREGRTPEPSAGIIDSQTAKTTEKGGLEVGTAQSA